MVQLSFSDLLTLGQTVGIIGSLMVVFYFSRRQIQKMSLDVETKVLNDLGEKIHRMGEMIIEKPELAKVIADTKSQKWSNELAFAFYVLYVCSYVHDMRERNVLNDNEWIGWLQWMRNVFQRGTIGEYWKEIEPQKWFDPSFRDFINKEIVEKLE